MTLILNPRGTNGSGKTTLATALCPPAEAIPLMLVDGPDRATSVPGYRTRHPKFGDVVLVGRYSPTSRTGGCDTVGTQDLICRAVRSAVERAPDVVLFEGLLISGLYGRYAELSEELRIASHDYVWVYMTTTLDECIRRVRARTEKKPGWDPGNVISKHRAVRRTRERALTDAEAVWDVANAEALGTKVTEYFIEHGNPA